MYKNVSFFFFLDINLFQDAYRKIAKGGILQ